MTEYAARRDPDRRPSHPGDLLTDVIPATGRTKTEVARLLGISRTQLYDLLAGRKPLSPEIAARVAKAFGGSTESWLRMQAAYDAWEADRTIDVSSVPVLTAA